MAPYPSQRPYPSSPSPVSDRTPSCSDFGRSSTAAATALFTFVFTGILGTALFQRRGSIGWRIAKPVCGGAVVFSVVGAWVASRIDGRPLALAIAAITAFAGIYILLPTRDRERFRDGDGRAERAMLAGVGAVSSFGSGLSGAGGPLFSVPMMVLTGFVPARYGRSELGAADSHRGIRDGGQPRLRPHRFRGRRVNHGF